MGTLLPRFNLPSGVPGTYPPFIAQGPGQVGRFEGGISKDAPGGYGQGLTDPRLSPRIPTTGTTPNAGKQYDPYGSEGGGGGFSMPGGASGPQGSEDPTLPGYDINYGNGVYGGIRVPKVTANEVDFSNYQMYDKSGAELHFNPYTKDIQYFSSQHAAPGGYINVARSGRTKISATNEPDLTTYAPYDQSGSTLYYNQATRDVQYFNSRAWNGIPAGYAPALNVSGGGGGLGSINYGSLSGRGQMLGSAGDGAAPIVFSTAKPTVSTTPITTTTTPAPPEPNPLGGGGGGFLTFPPLKSAAAVLMPDKFAAGGFFGLPAVAKGRKKR